MNIFVTPREHELIQKGLLLICRNKKSSDRDRREAESLWNRLLQSYGEEEKSAYTKN